MSAITDIASERQRQVSVEGWTAEHDDKHRHGQLAHAAAAYATHGAGSNDQVNVCANRANGGSSNVGWFFMSSILWPWSRASWKPTTSRRDLVKAGALIVAEIERLDRITAAERLTG